MVLAFAGDSTTTMFMKFQIFSFWASSHAGIERPARIRGKMGKAKRPVKLRPAHGLPLRHGILGMYNSQEVNELTTIRPDHSAMGTVLHPAPDHRSPSHARGVRDERRAPYRRQSCRRGGQCC